MTILETAAELAALRQPQLYDPAVDLDRLKYVLDECYTKFGIDSMLYAGGLKAIAALREHVE